MRGGARRRIERDDANPLVNPFAAENNSVNPVA
jgi:hypothetical protein